MKAVQLFISLTDELGIKAIVIQYNDTGLPSNSETLGNVAIAILKSLHLNKDSLMIQDLLSELNIDLPKKDGN